MSEIRRFYAQQSPFTSPGRHAKAFDALPDDVHALMATIQGLMLYDGVALPFYGHQLAQERHSDIHVRKLEDHLDRLFALDGRPLAVARPAHRRVTARCRSFVTFLIGALRHKGVAARARCGLGAYFNRGWYEDHWVCEYWDTAQGRWKLADPQFDAIWRENLDIQHDIADVPRDEFLVAAAAWQVCRSGQADPARFGLTFAGLHGLWFVAGDLVRDLAALNRMELLPWDVWGVQPRGETALDSRELAFFDDLAAIIGDPDANFAKHLEIYRSDEGLRVPSAVFNALTDQLEPAE